jgi:hypothetical protein
MLTGRKARYFLLLFFTGYLFSTSSFGQNAQIRGFIDGLASYEKGKVSFGFGEQDLFITAELHDRISFLGESVFKYTPSSPTQFSVSIERVVIKYNIAGNHNLLIGKHHTPLNYWNDNYHHGRVFFPTIERPLLFAANIIPLHTTGVSLQGHDLGKLKFGYDFMIGNGLGSSEIADNDKNKSITAAIHIKPVEHLRLGASYYHDVISKGADVHDHIVDWKVNQNLFTGSISYFGKKFEVLTEGTLALNKTDTTGSRQTLASYIYAGYRVGKKITPYVRLDNLNYQEGEIYYHKDNMTSFVAGIRYNVNFLVVVKLEFQHQNTEFEGNIDRVTTQFAIGF